MSSDRRFEYETGPDLEDEAVSDESDTSDDESGSNDGRDGRRQLVVSPWKAGAVSGVSAFAVVFTVTYHLVGAMFAISGTGGETEPSKWIMAGFMMLGSHGGVIERGEESIRAPFDFIGGLVSHVTALVPVIVLLVTAYLLVRYVDLETRQEAGLALGSLVATYVVPTIGLSTIARWTPNQEPSTTADAATVAVATDLSLFVAIGGTAITFVVIGAVVAAVPQLVSTIDE